jgi:hypothetical protein
MVTLLYVLIILGRANPEDANWNLAQFIDVNVGYMFIIIASCFVKLCRLWKFTGCLYETYYCVRFQVLTAASMMFRAVFWVVLPCKMIVDRPFYTAVQPRRQL